MDTTRKLRPRKRQSVSSLSNLIQRPTKRLRTMEDISCSVCMNQFHERNCVPKMLLCSHTLCEVCVQRLLYSSRVCPICRKEIKQTEYPTNLLALQLIELSTENYLSTSSASAGKCPGESEEVKSKVEEKIKRLDAKIDALNLEIDQSKAEIDRLSNQREISIGKKEKKQKVVESLQNGLAYLKAREVKLEINVGQTQRAFVQLKDLCVSGDQSDLDDDHFAQGGSLTLEEQNFRDEDAFRSEVAQRVKRGERVFCFEDVNEDRRYGGVTHGPGFLECHSLAPPREETLGLGAILVRLQELAPPLSARMESFLVLRNHDADGAQLRLTIRLNPSRSTRQFALLSTGERGPSYKGEHVTDTRGESVYTSPGRRRVELWGSRLFSVGKYMGNGREGTEAIEAFLDGYVATKYREGAVVIMGGGGGGFKMVKMERSQSVHNIVGVVTSPSVTVLESFLEEGFSRGVRVSDCGICVPV